MLTPDKVLNIHGLTINEKIIPWGAKWTKDYDTFKKGDKYKADKYMKKVGGITIHNTADLANVHDDAEQYTRATYPNQNMKTARVHYYVDDVSAWQNLLDNEIGWHDGVNGVGNSSTIAIEIIMNGITGEVNIKAFNNGALLTAILLDRHNLTVDDIYPHKHWKNNKMCPLYILSMDKGMEGFKAKVKEYLDMIQKPVVEEPQVEKWLLDEISNLEKNGLLNNKEYWIEQLKNGSNEHKESLKLTFAMSNRLLTKINNLTDELNKLKK